jgi:peptidoglycan/xylan/chitin deacetylase (PgdA/CDA1 family)
MELLATASGLIALGFSLRYTWWRKGRPGIPVLMYHQITDSLNNTPMPNLRVSPRRFAQQLDYLQKSGYTAITLGQAASGSLPAKPVALTFDDAYADFYYQAWPLLRERGMTATLFVVTSALGGSNAWDLSKGMPEEKIITREQLKELDAGGIEIGGHSHSHAALTELSERCLLREITGCQKTLTDIIGRPARVFSYPYGLYSEKVCRAVATAGFTLACTTKPGKLSIKQAANNMAIPRIIVKRSDNRLDFRLKLSRSQSRL